MKTILITGPIGSGKSEVRTYLSSKGFAVYDCDSRTKALYDKVPGLKERIEKALQTEWKDIREVFKDKSKLQKLEDMVYPLLIEDIKTWKRVQERGGSDFSFIESAVALQKPCLSELYDEVMMVEADRETRLKRNPYAAQRDSLQSFSGRKADYTIKNNSTIEELHTQIDKLLCRLI